MRKTSLATAALTVSIAVLGSRPAQAALTFSHSNFGEPQKLALSGVSFTSYNITGGNDFFQFTYPVGTNTIVEFSGGPVSISFGQPVISLVSSGVPEPASFTLMAIALTCCWAGLLCFRGILYKVGCASAALFLQALETLSSQVDPAAPQRNEGGVLVEQECPIRVARVYRSTARS